MRKQTVLQSLEAIALGGLLLMGFSTQALAATSPKIKSATTVPTSQTDSLKISPLRTSITIEHGQSSIVKTYVTNITKAPIQVHPIENDFVAGDENGTPAIILDENAYAPTHSLKRFMLPLHDVTVAPGEAKEIDVTISVPKSAQPGGYYGAIRFTPASASKGGQVNLNPSVASLVLLKVPGPTTELLNLTNFDIQQYGGTGTSFRTPNDINLLLRFQNKGNVQEAPFGQITVMKGKESVYTTNFNQKDPKENVLPDSSRRWTVPIKDLGKFGKYTITGTFSYANGKSIQSTASIWIVPTTYIYAGLGALAVLILIIVLIVALIRSKKGGSSRSKSRRYRR